MASSSFKNSMNSLGWSRRDNLPVNTVKKSSLLHSIKSFSLFKDSGYTQSLANESQSENLLPQPHYEDKEAWFTLSRWDRLLIFGGCNIGALACFAICFILWPIMMAKPRKFAILWSLGSLLFLVSWAAIMGPWTYVTHLISRARLLFTVTYFGSIILTLYFSAGLRNTALTFLSSLIQLTCLVWYLVSYFPMGSSGLRLAASSGIRGLLN